MIRVLLLALLLILPAPYDGPYFARRPLRPYPGVIPAGTWTEPGQVWRSDGSRLTKFWRSGGLKFCDDPDCWLCSEHVYEQEDE